MARVVSFESKKKSLRTQPTEVVCHYTVATADNGRTIVQLDTMGSADREKPGKQSQTLQFDESAGRQLIDILTKAFGSK